MAKKKKPSSLSPEERLAQALVPDWEQPYPVPENWCWVYLGAITTINPSKVSKEELPQQVSFVPMSAVSENTGAIEAAEIRRASDVASGYTYFQDNDIIFAKITPCMENGKSAIASNLKNGMAFGSTEFYVLRASCCLSKELLYHLLRSKWFRDEARENMSGAVGQQRVKKEFLLSYPFPLPPLVEQQRIVDRIESLFAKLDEAKEKVQAALDGFEARKAAILHQAFTGKLTAKWRKDNDVGMESWLYAKLLNVFDLHSGTTIPASNELPVGLIPYVKVGDMNLQENEVQITTSTRFVNACTASHIVPYGSTIFPKRGGAIYTNKKRFVGVKCIIVDLNTMAVIPKPEIIIDKYGYYWMLGIDLKLLNNGSNIPQINNKDMVKLVVPKPLLCEQTEIVRILDEFFAKEKKAKELCSVLENIDLIKKAILARAFRGQLGTNDSAEESAIQLLKSCLSYDVDENQASRKKASAVVPLPRQVRLKLTLPMERSIYRLLLEQGPCSLQEIVSIGKKDLQIMECVRRMVEKRLIQEMNNGFYGLTVE